MPLRAQALGLARGTALRLARGAALLLALGVTLLVAPARPAAAEVTHDEPPLGMPPASAGIPPAMESGAGSRSGNGGVLVVGDSLEVLTSPYLRRQLRGLPVTVNAVGGYNSFQIFDLFAESFKPSHSVIVFDAGTNDNPAYPEILAGNLQAVAERVGDRCMVVPSIHGLTVNGVGNGGKNRVVYSFAASRPGTQVPDWAGTVAAHPELMQSDDLHPTPEGADYRARLIAEAVYACLTPLQSELSGPGRARAAAPAPDPWAAIGRALSAWTARLRATGRALLEPVDPVLAVVVPNRLYPAP